MQPYGEVLRRSCGGRYGDCHTTKLEGHQFRLRFVGICDGPRGSLAQVAQKT